MITGATSGIGRASARELSKTGVNLVLVGRKEEVGTRLAAELGRRPRSGQVRFLRADLSDQSQVRALASAIAVKYPRIEILINNAGARFNRYQHSPDGIELTFATNHLSHFLLTGLLLENLQRAKEARVITVASGAHRGAGANGPWFAEPEHYDRKLAYCQSKLANILFAFELARRMHKTAVVSNALDPGGVATNLGRNNGLLSWCRHLAYYALRRELLTPHQGAETVVFLAASPSVNGISGKYFYRKREVEPSTAALDPQAAERLWSLSKAMTGLEAQTRPAEPLIDTV